MSGHGGANPALSFASLDQQTAQKLLEMGIKAEAFDQSSEENRRKLLATVGAGGGPGGGAPGAGGGRAGAGASAGPGPSARAPGVAGGRVQKPSHKARPAGRDGAARPEKGQWWIEERELSHRSARRETLPPGAVARALAEMGHPGERVEPELEALVEAVNSELLTSLAEFAGAFMRKSGDAMLQPHHMALHALRAWSLQVPGFTGRPLECPAVSPLLDRDRDTEALAASRDLRTESAHGARAAATQEGGEKAQ